MSGVFSSLSANGRYVAFASTASNLVAEDIHNINSDIFVHDRLTKQTTRVSVDSNGIQGDGESRTPSISADGRYIAFMSLSRNLVAPRLVGRSEFHIFVHDRVTKKTTLVGKRDPRSYSSPSITSDGRYVLFESDSPNLVPGDTNGLPDIFVYDRQSNQTTRVNVNSSGQETKDYWSYTHPNSCISADGRYVLFMSPDSNLVAGDTNKGDDMFVHDRQTHQTTRINLKTYGYIDRFGISANGRFVGFSSTANNLVIGDNNKVTDVFVHDQLTHQNTIVSINATGEAGGGRFDSISPDGRYVVFTSAAALVAGDTNGTSDVYVRDRLKQTIARVSVGVASNGHQSSSHSLYGQISADGRYVIFIANDGNVAGDTNGFFDVFVRDRRLDTSHKADLQVTVNQKPSTLVRNNQGSYIYNITNNGPDAIGLLRVTHLVSNGQVIGFTPSQGTCNRYATIGLCELGLLPVGGTITLQLDIKAMLLPALRQQISISSNGRADPKLGNNYLTMNTPVTIP